MKSREFWLVLTLLILGAAIALAWIAWWLGEGQSVGHLMMYEL